MESYYLVFNYCSWIESSDASEFRSNGRQDTMAKIQEKDRQQKQTYKGSGQCSCLTLLKNNHTEYIQEIKDKFENFSRKRKILT